ncbi:S8 family serine peptidase [Kineosporia babensis]|uniref:S8 family serine peptidase n=1 Tax=Kineosporia babensis TaxID=499548 RepID=A0A9X1N9N6_9ACTN|nr:S8 family serine peptidase [Kineosporia babensis]
MTEPRAPRRPFPLRGKLNRRRTLTAGIAVGVTAVAATAVTLTPVASALPAALGGSTVSSAPLVGAGSASAIEGEYLVMLKDDAGLRAAGVDGAGEAAGQFVAQAAERGEEAGATVQKRFEQLRGYAAELTEDQLEEIREDPAVEYVAVNQRYKIATTQPDPVWNLDRIDQRSSRLSGSYYYTNTGKGVTAYVVDTGIRSSHREFTTSLSGAKVKTRVGAGKSTLSNDRSTQDCEGHGTHVAGAIGGSVYGVAKEATLVPVRVLDCKGYSTSSIVAEGLDWIASDHRSGQPAVANLSLTNEGGADPVLEAAVSRLIADGVTVVIAAGNGDAAGQGVPACGVSPSNVRAALVVGATNRSDRKTGFSNYGACVDLFAPGLGIKSAWADSDTSTNTVSGTSMAAPQAAGVAALYLQNHPKATPKQVHAALAGAASKNVVGKVSTKFSRNLLFAPQPVKAPAATTKKSSIPAGRALLSGKKITSPNGLYTLTQTSKDLTLTRPGGQVLWRTNKSAAWTRMTSSGNLVSYNKYGQRVWSSGTSGGAATLKLDNRGVASVVRNAGGSTLWKSGKAQKSAPKQNAKGKATMDLGAALYRGGHTLTSKNGTYTLALRADGNLAVTKKGAGAVWSTGKKDADWLTLRKGNLALVNSSGKTVWQSKTAGKGADQLRLRDNGTLQLVKKTDSKVVWTAQ